MSDGLLLGNASHKGCLLRIPTHGCAVHLSVCGRVRVFSHGHSGLYLMVAEMDATDDVTL